MVEVDDTVGFLASKQALLRTKLSSLNQVKKNLKRGAEVPEFSKEKRQKLEQDIKLKRAGVLSRIQCASEP